MDLKDLVDREIERYINWPTADKSIVTTASAKLFAEHVVRLYADRIPDAGKTIEPAGKGDPVAWEVADPDLHGDVMVVRLSDYQRLQAECEKMRKDAERYRWLRDPCSGAERVVMYGRGDYGRGLMAYTMLDEAIDAATHPADPGCSYARTEI